MPLQANLFLEPYIDFWLITYTLVPSTRNVPPASEGCGMRPESKRTCVLMSRNPVRTYQPIRFNRNYSIHWSQWMPLASFHETLQEV
jgi:hypothetical protein